MPNLVARVFTHYPAGATVKTGDAHEVRRLVAASVKVDEQDADGAIVLHWFASQSREGGGGEIAAGAAGRGQGGCSCGEQWFQFSYRYLRNLLLVGLE